MIDQLKTISNLADFFQIRPFNIHEFSHEYFIQSDYCQNYQDHFSKINDVLFPLNDSFGIRVLTNVNTPYLIQSSSAVSVIDGTCSLETLDFTEKNTGLSWLNEISSTSLEKRTLQTGDKLELKTQANRYFILRLETKCVVAHWNYQAKSESNMIERFKFDFFQLSHQGRKLIKLTKNIYANGDRRSEQDLKSDFYRILDRISEKDLFLIYVTKSYLIYNAQLTDFKKYYEHKYSHLLNLSKGSCE